jgi:hypothetical protein
MNRCDNLTIISLLHYYTIPCKSRLPLDYLQNKSENFFCVGVWKIGIFQYIRGLCAQSVTERKAAPDLNSPG